MTEPMLDYVVRRLNEHKGEWPRIEKDTGVDYDTIAKIAQGARTNPTIENLQPLYDWCVARDEMTARLSRKKVSA